MAHEPWRDEPVDAAQDAVHVERPRYRPPIGIPSRVGSSRRVTVVSVALHLLVVLLIISPWAAPAVLREIEGAGGPGPAGGGGGGTMGTGGRQGMGVRERLHYVQVQAAPAPAAPTPAVVPPPVVPPKPTPTPVPVPPAVTPPQPAAPAVTTTPQASAETGASAPIAGVGGGTGNDGTAGSGPGSGGGVGSGVGTGRGSGMGPGTGGGNAEVYPPQPTEVFIPPLPYPKSVRGTKLLAIFDVDSTGKVLGFEFTQTRDGGYNRKLREVLNGFRFKPGTRPDGTPVRAKGQIAYEF
ncbi:hypothetical protein [Roseisolibacter agri]|uniref:TonB C-terminal domain-containing protein n=1 Tax=Roseisolibacter agri TaxID=2014610 RepID=A0AA37QKT0_9BACT|nr:hypothetical protein [Roseisolibacter agri]GLC27608.1 hypothetical protein rosag_41210 [Roseisolibacter agri]